jgi:hypothetical protein
LIRFYSIVSFPILPCSSQKMRDMFEGILTIQKNPDAPRFPERFDLKNAASYSELKIRLTLLDKPLFPKITDEQIADWEERFGKTKV